MNNSKYIYQRLGNSGLNPFYLNEIILNIYRRVSYLEYDYPGFTKWYFSKVLDGLIAGERDIITAFDNDQLAGFSIIKNDITEKKICTLNIFEQYQKSGIGRRLILESLDFLDIDKPLITVPEKHINKYSRLMDYFNFELSEVKQDFYNIGKKEFVFNGIL